MNKQAKEMRVNDRLRQGQMRYVPGKKLVREVGREIGSTAVLTAGLAGLAAYFGSKFVESLQESVRQGRHAARTVGEMAVDTPGERAVKRLDEFYKNMDVLGLTLDQNTGRVQEHIAKRIEAVETLNNAYQRNEDFIRQSERLLTQLEGIGIEATAAGDIAAKEKGEASLIASDILDNIHKAIVSCKQ